MKFIDLGDKGPDFIREMDSQGYRGSRDSIEDDAGKKEYYGKVAQPDDVVKQGAKALDNAFNHKEDDWSKDFESRIKKGVAEGAEDMTPNWAKYVLKQLYNSNGSVTMTDLFDEHIPGLHAMFMATAQEHRLDPEEDFQDVEHEVLLKLEHIVNGGHGLDEASLAQMRDYFNQADSDSVKVDRNYDAPSKKQNPLGVPPEIQALVNKMYHAGKISPQEFEVLRKFQQKTKINVGIREADKNPYAIGMSQAMKSTGDKPPLKKSTINKAHAIARAIKKGD
jgi:hypothetical protein